MAIDADEVLPAVTIRDPRTSPPGFIRLTPIHVLLPLFPFFDASHMAFINVPSHLRGQVAAY